MEDIVKFCYKNWWFLSEIESIFFDFLKLFSQKIKNHLCWRKSRHCNHKTTSLRANAKQSRKILSSNIFHWTASSDFILPRRDVCSQSFIAGLHPAYNAKKENWLSNQFSFSFNLDVGNELSSQEVALQVFSPLRVFTTVFGMTLPKHRQLNVAFAERRVVS